MLMLPSSNNAQQQQQHHQQQPSTPTVLAVQPIEQNKNTLCRFNPCIQPRCNNRHEAGQHRCKYRPCVKKTCTMEHDPGQQTPDENEMKLKTMFAAENKCRWNHDGTCIDKHKCSRIHGNDSIGGDPCEHVGKGMCPDFFVGKGCPKSHKRLARKGL